MRTDAVVSDVFLIIRLLHHDNVGVYFLSNLEWQAKQTGLAGLAGSLIDKSMELLEVERIG